MNSRYTFTLFNLHDTKHFSNIINAVYESHYTKLLRKFKAENPEMKFVKIQSNVIEFETEEDLVFFTLKFDR